MRKIYKKNNRVIIKENNVIVYESKEINNTKQLDLLYDKTIKYEEKNK